MTEGTGGNRSTVSWRRQALLWPAICSSLVLAFYGFLFVALGGLSTGPVLRALMWVPIAVLVSVIVFGGGAIVVALTVRTLFRRFAPRAPAALRTGVLTVVTGVSETSGTMVTVAAAGGDTGGSTWGFAVGIGVVAALAASIYARDLFAEVPEPLDWNREAV
ncbi:hypothetical protein HQ602_17320 [Rhodococcus kroppenstedtii]|uniref:hypothetical protein n=1 Tax=Rhodococcoides kroppenstedtii TaxID=293050 RepID=UPI001C9AAAF8|nr:hypothetical protein [Rhodococcus kroppenstedtii]MBY6438137.1 hypothetical protein [Rhodococcus kroppenstedtii]